MHNVAILLGAGNSTRMKSDKSKLLLNVGGMTVIERTVKIFSQIDAIDEIVVVCRDTDLDEFETVLADYDISYCFGGSTRQQSVKNAVETIEDCNLLIIHDGARPLVTEEEILKTIDAAGVNKAAAVGVAVKDTIKIVDDDKKIIDTPDRSKLISIRTPQIFDFELYKKAMKKAEDENKDFTDDCALIENCSQNVYCVLGEYSNIKITTPDDIAMAEGILKMRGEL